MDINYTFEGIEQNGALRFANIHICGKSTREYVGDLTLNLSLPIAGMLANLPLDQIAVQVIEIAKALLPAHTLHFAASRAAPPALPG